MKGQIVLSLFFFCSACTPAAQRPTLSPDDFFGVTNLWTFELRLTRKVWDGISNERTPFGTPKPVDVKLEIDGRRYSNVVVRLKGGGTRTGIPQGRPPLRLTFGQTNAFPVQELSLNNNVFDTSFMRDALSYKLFNDFGVSAPKTAYAKLYVIFTDSEVRRYIGLYTASEVVDAQFVQTRFEEKSGLLFKPELGHQSFTRGSSWKEYEPFLIPKSPATPEQQARMLAFIRLVNHSDAGAFQNEISSYIDLDNYLRFVVVNVVLANLDSYLAMGKNYYMYLDAAAGKLHWIPWDHDLSFGGFFLCGTTEERVNLSIDNPSTVNDTLLKRVLSIPVVKQRYHELLRDFLARHFQAESMFRQIDRLAEIIQPAVLEEKRKSPAAFKRSIDGRNTRFEDRGFSPFEGGIMEPGLKVFVEQRIESIQAQLAGKSRGARPAFGR